MSYFDQITKFLHQSGTTKLTTNDYLKTYRDLKIKVSFGQGRKALIPWIAFLKPGNTVRDGIYPLYLYYSDIETLILAYGVSETFNSVGSKGSWKLESPLSLKEYFERNNYTGAVRYENSLFFMSYNVSTLNREEVERDLDLIVETYRKM